MHITADSKMFAIRNVYVNKRRQRLQNFSGLQHNLVCIPKKLEDKRDTSITRQETNRETMVFFLQYRLCKNFWFLKSSIIFFTKSKVTTSPSILAPEYCGSTSSIKTKYQNLFISMSEIIRSSRTWN